MIIQHLYSMWEMRLGEYREYSLACLTKNRPIYGSAWKRSQLVPCFFFPSSCLGWKWGIYVDLALQSLVLDQPVMSFYHINPCEIESGCGCYGRMRTMSGSRRLKRPDCFQALSVLGEWWRPSQRTSGSTVQVNKQHTVGCIMILKHCRVCLLGWGFFRGG